MLLFRHYRFRRKNVSRKNKRTGGSRRESRDCVFRGLFNTETRHFTLPITRNAVATLAIFFNGLSLRLSRHHLSFDWARLFLALITYFRLISEHSSDYTFTQFLVTIACDHKMSHPRQISHL